MTLHHLLRFTPLLALSFQTLSASSLPSEREIIPLESGWLFIRQDADIASPSADWEKITVPHTWNAQDAQDGPPAISDKQESESEAIAVAPERKTIKTKSEDNGEASKSEPKDPHVKNQYYRGACWYEHQLQIPAEWEGKKRVFIRFEAAGSVAKTYVNKTLLGEHRGAFTAFCYELTDYLKYGRANEIRVQVDNTAREDLPPLGGDFNIYGGLYRPAEMIVTDLVCISPLDYASSGVYLTTKKLAVKKADVEVRSMISNGNMRESIYKKVDKTPGAAIPQESKTKEKKQKTPIAPVPGTAVAVVTEVRDAKGAVVARISTPCELPLETTVPVVQNLTIKDPHLWNGRMDPYLYDVQVTVEVKGSRVDQVNQPLGLRTVAISKEQGFLLNGQPYPVHGVCRHQDIRNKGWAIAPEDEEKDAAIMAEMGVTAVRNAHYPQSENWHQINDRSGVLLWNELSLVDATRATRAFWMNSEEYLSEMIHQLYNHPSIAWWGIFNELENHPTPPSGPELAHLQDVAKGIDPNRIVVAASCHQNRYINQITEQMGFNTYPGWYGEEKPGNPVPMAERIQQRADEVGKRIAISEYGAGGSIAHHIEGAPVKPNPAHGGPFHPEEWQAFVHEQDWSQMKDNPNLWGSFLWNMFDFACATRHEGSTPSVNDKGLVTHDRMFRKDAFYFYKANWNPEPMVYIASRRSVNRTQPVTEVKVYSNAPEVELIVNGQSCGVQKPDGVRITRWPSITLQVGENTIEAVAKTKGGSVTDSCKWILQPPKP